MNNTPGDLARAIQANLRRRKKQIPTLKLLDMLTEALFVASLRTEEGEPISCHIVYLDPSSPDPTPPQRIVRDRWSPVYFDEHLPFTIQNIVKLARASDPRTSSIAIYRAARDELKIWGLVDQGNRAHEFVNRESRSGTERPGLFQVSIAGLGHLVAMMGFTKIAELRVNSLLTNAQDVFWKGPIHEVLIPALEDAVSRVRERLPEEVFTSRDHWTNSIAGDWVASLCRLLLRIQGFRHGGALLLTPDETFRDLKIKHRVDYRRLTTCLDNKA